LDLLLIAIAYCEIDREEGSTTCKPIVTGSLEKQWHDIKVQFAAFVGAKA
jgi:hypothetical protein